MAAIVADMVQVHPFRLRGGVVEHLVLERSMSVEFYPGIWQVVTGFIEEGERSLATARRELLEETRLRSDEWYALPDPESFFFAPIDRIVLVPVIACRIDIDSEVSLSAEHASYLWLPSADAAARLVFPSQVRGLNAVDALALDPPAHRQYLLSG